MKLLLAAATEAEITPTLSVLQGITPHNHQVDVCITGVGLLASTFSLTRALLQNSYDFVLQAGIAGSFNKDVALGTIVIVQSEQLGDLGAEDGDDFIDIFSLGFVKKDQSPFTSGLLLNPLTSVPFNIDLLPKVSGLTVHAVSGSEPTIEKRAKHFSPDIESMEGASLHYTCLQLGIPFLQVRALSNYVTRRDRSSWKIGDAVNALNHQLIQWIKDL